MHLL
ncbi:hypothetical protein CP061683_2598A, partial [Chlamydia psittaci 06-1683]|jgi:hypothetical protein